VHHYSAYTLVDITNTNVNQSKKLLVQSNQQQNLNTLVQSVGLRSQPIDPVVSVLMTQDIVNYEFGNAYQGLHTVWRLDFSIEHNDVFNKNGNKTFHLLNDCDGVAIYTNLEETTELKTKSFETISTKLVNLYFKYNHQI
tara:strand:+ start:1114 stop:1533 length:420 start_codon:yes stop_codon:yes gene_type:complete